MAPPLSLFFTYILPLWALMIEWLIASPMPVPPGFQVVRGSKIVSSFSGSIPVPESSIYTDESIPESIFGEHLKKLDEQNQRRATFFNFEG